MILHLLWNFKCPFQQEILKRLEVPSWRCPGFRIFSTTKILSNCTYTDKTNLQTILMCRRIQNGIIYPWGWSESRVYPGHNPDLISSRDFQFKTQKCTLRGSQTSWSPRTSFLASRPLEVEFFGIFFFVGHFYENSHSLLVPELLQLQLWTFCTSLLTKWQTKWLISLLNWKGGQWFIAEIEAV